MKKEYMLPTLTVPLGIRENICQDDWNVVSGTTLEGIADEDDF